MKHWLRCLWLSGYFRIMLMSGIWIIPPIMLGLNRSVAALLYSVVFLLGVIDNQGVWWRIK